MTTPTPYVKPAPKPAPPVTATRSPQLEPDAEGRLRIIDTILRHDRSRSIDELEAIVLLVTDGPLIDDEDDSTDDDGGE